jgi:hypothetical protein
LSRGLVDVYKRMALRRASGGNERLLGTWLRRAVHE